MATEHPARAASRRSMEIVQSKGEGAREKWLALFADDAVIEDPIGPSPLDPDGKGHRGKDAISAFWDLAIAPVQLQIDIRGSYAAGNEVANVGTITSTLANGTTITVEGVFTYRVDAAGKIVALRAYWEFDKMVASMRKA
jgi:steroid delta-isomerase